MNSFFIQPTIADKTKGILADQLRQASQKTRVEAEVWHTSDIRQGLQTALAQTSPTIVAVGSRTWFDRIITATHSLKASDLPAFAFIPFDASRLHPLSPFLIRRGVNVAIGSLAARKVSHLTIFQVNNSLFTETCSIGQAESRGTFQAKLSLLLNNGNLTASSQASRIDLSLLESIQEEAPLLRLGIRSELINQSARPSKVGLLPDKRTSLKTHRYEDALHIPIEKGSLISTERLICLSHPEVDVSGALNFQPYPKKLKFITSKNQPIRY